MIFDIDGTLADTFPVAFSAFRSAVAEFTDRRFADEDLIAMFGPSEDGILQRLLPEHWERCFERFVSDYAERHALCSAPFPGIDVALDVLKSRGVRLAIVTGKAARTAAITLERVGIADYFDAVETGSAEGGVKPRAMRTILDAWRLSPRSVAYIGDAVSDIEAARAVGVVALGAAWGGAMSAAELEKAGADMVFADVESFIRWLGACDQSRI